MESLNERKRAEGEADLISTRVGELLERIALKVRRAAARIAKPDWTDLSAQTSAIDVIGAQSSALLHRIADCVERIDPAAIDKSVTQKVRSNPGSSLLIAGVTGFILSAMFRRR